MSWTASGNIKTATEIADLPIVGEVDEAQHKLAVKQAKALLAAAPKADEYIVTIMGQVEADVPGQPHMPEWDVHVRVATTRPLPDPLP